MSMKLAKIDSELENKAHSLSKTKTLSKSVNLESEIRELQCKRDEISEKVDSLNQKMTSGELTVSN